MSIINNLRLFYLSYLSKPAADRPLYRAIRRYGARKIVELGVADCRRALRLIEIAKQASPDEEIHYVGMDRFEGRSESEGQGIALKAAHQLLRATGERIQLVPGKPSESLIRLANSLGKVDLLILPADLETPAMARAWFFVPRMLHDGTLVFLEHVSDDGVRTLQRKTREEIDQLASPRVIRRAA